MRSAIASVTEVSKISAGSISGGIENLIRPKLGPEVPIIGSSKNGREEVAEGDRF